MTSSRSGLKAGARFGSRAHRLQLLIHSAFWSNAKFHQIVPVFFREVIFVHQLQNLIDTAGSIFNQWIRQHFNQEWYVG
ncbi:hypothetical protein OGATHE_002520 [Ogataea polymorpha]|uniref:Uncharacterized protein n=1 Tax=Ogataea polymorpha TaxID=460523 RepID=A0A9P8T7Z0_9ASCO|nr:hypothetical protein OGATHE_002520 [Ogataea polymorpha]